MRDPLEYANEVLDGLLAAPHTASTIPGEQVRMLLTLGAARQSALAAVQIALAARLVAESQPVAAQAGVDKLLTIEEAAEVLNTDPAWLTRNSKRFPFMVPLTPRVKRVSEARLLAWVAKNGTPRRR